MYPLKYKQMNVYTHKAEIIELISNYKKEGKSIGFVPTMGALHKGHLSLVNNSVSDNDITVVSIFVNPTQFNNPADLKSYPRMVNEDLEKLKTTNCDIVFCPEVEEIYPEKDTREFDFGYLDNVMEGKNRPGHFNGVGQVVSKLFDIIKPHRAYFGMKDFQQVAVIKKLINILDFDIEIVACPIIREFDGLAMSSRNQLLTEEHRKNAPHIYNTLIKACKFAGEKSVHELKEWVINEINSNPYLEVEYFDIVDDTELKPVKDWNEESVKVGCITVQAGNVRLIDNITF